jgi:hypothetical protein
MSVRFLSRETLTALVTIAFLGLQATAAAQVPAVRAAATDAGAAAWTAPRTAWGEPDLQGIWTNTTTTPLERPARFGGREFLTDEERAELDAQAVRNADRQPQAGDPGAYNTFWLENGKRSARTSLVIDPPDGKLPPVTPLGKQRSEEIEQVRLRPPDSWHDVNIYERCITRGMPGAMMPGFYNHNYQILQVPGYVVILVEMIHDVRIIPLDGRPHLTPNVRQWLGDSRGRWEGNTLVVETTNFDDRVYERRPSNAVFGISGNLHLVERFTRVDPDTIDYQFTVTDPTTFTRPWTAAIPMSRLEGQIYEYACHEGNYGLMNILRGARVCGLDCFWRDTPANPR